GPLGRRRLGHRPGLGARTRLPDLPGRPRGAPGDRLAAERLRRARLAVAGAVVATGLCSVVFWPGVVDAYDLDARPVNALAAAGVALAVVLSFAAGLHRERVRLRPAAGALLVLAIPWLAADLGFHLDGVPVLGS